MKIVVAPDLHLWPVSLLRMPAMRGDSYHAAAQIFDYASKHSLPLLLPGDIFDYGERGGVASCLEFLLPRLQGISVYYIYGSHDDPRYTAGVKNPGWLDTVAGSTATHIVGKHDIDGVCFYGIDSCNRQQLQEQLDQLPDGIDVLVMHQGTRELLGYESGEYKAYDFEAADVAGKARLVIVGHVHQYATFTAKQTKFLSPGCAVDFDPDAKPSFCVVDLETFEIERILLKRRPSFKFDLVNSKDWQQFGEWLYKLPDATEREIDKPYVNCRYVPNEEYIELLDVARAKVHFDGSAVATEAVVTEQPQQQSTDDEIAEVTAMYVNRDAEPELFDLAVELQRSSRPPQDILQEIVKQIVEGEVCTSST